MADDPAWLQGSALEETVLQLEPEAEVVQESAVHIFLLLVAVWRWDGGLGG